jgi:hypothetical protein
MADRGLVTTSGKALIADVLATNIATLFQYMAHGTGTTQTEVTDAALETKSADTVTTVTATSPTNTLVLAGTMVSAAGTVATEVGLFPAIGCTSACAYHETFPAVTLATGDEINYTITLTIT